MLKKVANVWLQSYLFFHFFLYFHLPDAFGATFWPPGGDSPKVFTNFLKTIHMQVNFFLKHDTVKNATVKSERTFRPPGYTFQLFVLLQKLYDFHAEGQNTNMCHQTHAFFRLKDPSLSSPYNKWMACWNTTGHSFLFLGWKMWYFSSIKLFLFTSCDLDVCDQYVYRHQI